MARIDKVTQIVRATAGTALTGVLGVALDAGGSVIPSGTADAFGVVCLPGTIAAGRPVGVLLHGEIVEFGGSAATEYFAGAGGSVSAAAGGAKIGTTIEGDRLVVNM
jgi:hypothetical protein